MLRDLFLTSMRLPRLRISGISILGVVLENDSQKSKIIKTTLGSML